MRTETEIEKQITKLEKVQDYTMKLYNYCNERMHKIMESTSLSKPFSKRYNNLDSLQRKYFDKWYVASRMTKALNWALKRFDYELP